MSEIDHAEILKQMGITRWVVRDAVPAEQAGEQAEPHAGVNEQLITDKPAQRTADTEATGPVVQDRPGDPERKVMPQQKASHTLSADTLDTLRARVENCTACSLAESRTQTVFGTGPKQSDWLFIGEAPGQQEDRQGKPFVGRAGSLFTQMLRALGQEREQVFIANALKCRPPGNRDPLAEELEACESFLLRQIELLQPKVIVALGRISAQALLKSEQSLGRMRGQVHQYGAANIPLIVTYHPAYLLRKPADKVKVWEDLLLANRQLSG